MEKYYVYSYKSVMGKLCYAKQQGTPSERGTENAFRFKLIDKQEISKIIHDSLSLDEIVALWKAGELPND